MIVIKWHLTHNSNNSVVRNSLILYRTKRSFDKVVIAVSSTDIIQFGM